MEFKVSVLVPIYNVERYLEKCLQSLCNQTLSDIEILCINDGSTDSSKAIVESFKKKDLRIVLIDKENTGYGSSMNVGLEQARGTYIAIVESDDFIDSDMMERLYEMAETYNLDIVKSTCYFYSDGSIAEENRYVNIFDDLVLNDIFCPLDREKLFLKMQTIWSALYRREFLIKNGIRFNETPGASYQDISFAFQVYTCAERAMLVPDAFYHYRINNINSSVKAIDKVFCVCDELEMIDRFITQRGKNTKRLQIIASRLGYRVMMETYRSLAEAFQYALFLKMMEYLKKYRDLGLICGEIWDNEAVKNVESILSNPHRYFISTAKSFKDDRLMSDVCLNQSVYANAVIEQILLSPYIVIYGAGKIGKEFLKHLNKSGYAKDQISFVVTNIDENEKFISDIPVHPLGFYQEKRKEVTIVLAISEQIQFEIADNLRMQGFKRVFSLDSAIRKYINSFGMVLRKK